MKNAQNQSTIFQHPHEREPDHTVLRWGSQLPNMLGCSFDSGTMLVLYFIHIGKELK
jgi:hypothetical protein